MRSLVFPIVLAGLAVASCNGTTGDQLITFDAYAAGARGASDPFVVYGVHPAAGASAPPADETFTVQLTKAQMYVGAIYVNEAPAGSGGTFNSPACIDPGVYSMQVPGGLEVDLLNPSPQKFSVQGNGTADQSLSWELYMVDGDVNAQDINAYGTPNTADLAGTARRASDGKVFEWAATVTINANNRGEPAQYPGQPGLNPICKQRILELSGIDFTPYQGGALLLTIDPRGWFKQPLDFSQLPTTATEQCHLDTNVTYTSEYCIPDSSRLSGGMLGSQQGSTLFTGIFTGGNAAYTLSYVSSP